MLNSNAPEAIAPISHLEPTSQLFSAHIGCGKSTELQRLRTELEQQGFYVVYFESSQDLVVIIYNLDRLDMRPVTASGLGPPEDLFIDRGEQLQKLNCHIVYTIPLDSIAPIFTTYRLRNSI